MLSSRSLSRIVLRLKNQNRYLSSTSTSYSNIIVNSLYSKGFKVPDCSITDYCFENSKNWLNKTAVTCGTTGRSYDYGTTIVMINRMAKALLSVRGCGLNSSHTIGILLPSIPEFVPAIHGALTAGIRCTFVNPLYTPDEVSRQFQSANVKLVITIPELQETVDIVKNDLPDYRGTIQIGGDDNYDKKIYGFKSLLSNDYKAELPEIDPDSIAIIPYSSGTTGLPKGVLLTHRNLAANIAQGSHAGMCKYRDPKISIRNEGLLTIPPYFHIYGFNGLLNLGLREGANVISLPKFTPEDYINALVKYRPPILGVVPAILLFLASHPKVTSEHLSCIEEITVGAAPAPIHLIEKFRLKSGDKCAIRQGYGMTETSPVTLVTPYPYMVDPRKVGTAGQLYPCTEARIVALADGKDQVSYGVGELYIRGPQVTQGYLNNEEATKETIDSDGWIHTGDVAYYDDDGYFFIVDRTKELIKVKGNQVSPTELENIIIELDGISDVAVVGIPDDVGDEAPRAFIVLKPDSKLTADEIINYVKEKVIKYKQLSGGVQFVKVIPRNPTGKVMRNELKASCASYE